MMNLRKNVFTLLLVGGLAFGANTSAMKLDSNYLKTQAVDGLNYARNFDYNSLWNSTFSKLVGFNWVLDKAEEHAKWNNLMGKMFHKNEYKFVKYSANALITLSGLKQYVVGNTITESAYNKVWTTIALSTVLGKIGASGYNWYVDKTLTAPVAPVKGSKENNQDFAKRINTYNTSLTSFVTNNELVGVVSDPELTPVVLLPKNSDDQAITTSLQDLNATYARHAQKLVNSNKDAFNKHKGNHMLLAASAMTAGILSMEAVQWATANLATVGK